MATASCPTGWDTTAHALWAQGQQRPAIDATLQAVNRHGPVKPLPLALQLAYYIFLAGDPATAAQLLEHTRQSHPKEPEVLRNLAACLSRSGQHAQALVRMQELIPLTPNDPLIWDTLASCHSRLNEYEEAAKAGTRALQLKDQAHPLPPKAWQLPEGDANAWLSPKTFHNVIAFSLWGANPRYLRGALDNMLAAPTVYPGWSLRFYSDSTVPVDLLDALRSLGAQVCEESAGQTLRERLAWRFQVANDATVGRFLVRDVDSCINPRERAAVDAWIASGRWFHVMRDWWTHTDLMLAGMWGGVATVLPPLRPLLVAYRPPTMETPNIDQWFLRDVVWPYVRQSCLAHDRCFTPDGAVPWPLPSPPGSLHVGQDVFAVELAAQAGRLAAWAQKVPSLKL